MVLFLHNVHFYLDFERSNPVCHVNSAFWMLQWLKGTLQLLRSWSSSIFSVISMYRQFSSKSLWLKKGEGWWGRTRHGRFTVKPIHKWNNLNRLHLVLFGGKKTQKPQRFVFVICRLNAQLRCRIQLRSFSLFLFCSSSTSGKHKHK